MHVTLRPARGEEIDIAFELKRDAMGPHIMAKWAWNEEYQRQHHLRRWNEKPWLFILAQGQIAGTVSLDWQATHLQFGEFYMSSQHRGRGLGTQVLRQALAEADARGVEVRLEFLKWNPVRQLYLRHGFRIVHENEIHYFAVRAPNAA